LGQIASKAATEVLDPRLEVEDDSWVREELFFALRGAK